MRKTLVSSICFLMLTACMGSNSTAPVTTANRPTSIDSLVEAAKQIAIAETELAVATKAIRKTHIDSAKILPSELRRTVELVEGVGYLPLFASRLAEQAGYTFTIYGKPPTQDQLLHIKYEGLTIIEAFTDLGVLAAGRATVRVNAPEATVAICYPSCGGAK